MVDLLLLLLLLVVVVVVCLSSRLGGGVNAALEGAFGMTHGFVVLYQLVLYVILYRAFCTIFCYMVSMIFIADRYGCMSSQSAVSVQYLSDMCMD